MNGYQIALIIGACAASTVFIAYVVSYLVQWIWSFIDESPMAHYNWFAHQLCRLWGFTLNRPAQAYTHTKPGGGSSDGEGPCFISILFLFCAPTVIWASIQFYPIALTVGTTFGIVFLARFSRRMFKRLGKHEKDPKAHQG